MVKRQAKRNGLGVSAYIRGMIYSKDIPSWNEQGKEGIPVGEHYTTYKNDDIETKGDKP